MNNLLKDFKIQPTKLRGENMEKEIQILTRYEDPTIKQLQQELTNLKAIEKEHQRMNGELREENKQLKEKFLKQTSETYLRQTKIDKAIEYINSEMFDYMETQDLLEKLKGENDEK